MSSSGARSHSEITRADPVLITPVHGPVGPARRFSRPGCAWFNGFLRIPSRILLPGLLGGILLSVGGLGAGAVARRDPLLSGTVLNVLRYGHGHDLAFAAVYLGVALMVLSWVRLGRMVRIGWASGRMVARTSMAWTASLMLAPPLYSRDVYSYLAQGAVALNGFDPYTTGASVLELPLRGNVASLWLDSPSPYGPLFLFLGKLTVAVTGDNIILGTILMRVVSLAGLVILAWAVPGLARHLGGRAPVALWLTVANPLVVIVGFGGAHNDILMVGLMALGVLMVLQRRHLLGIAVIALAVAVKVTAILVVPFLVWVWAARLSGTAGQRFFKATAAGGAVFGIVFALATLVAGVDLGWVNVLRSQGPLLTWMSLPCAAAEIAFYSIGRHFGSATYEGFLGFFRAAGMVLLVAVLVRQWWLARAGGVDVIRRAAVALFAACVLAPSVLPWYFIWTLVIAAAFAWNDRWLAVLAGTSVWMVLITLPDGTIVARWTYGSMNPSVWWPYLAATVVVGIWAAGALLQQGLTPVRSAFSSMRSVFSVHWTAPESAKTGLRVFPKSDSSTENDFRSEPGVGAGDAVLPGATDG